MTDTNRSPAEPPAYRLLVEAASVADRWLAADLLDLHRPEGRVWAKAFGKPWIDWRCAGDDMAGYDAEQPDWPCETVERIAKHLGVSLNDD